MLPEGKKKLSFVQQKETKDYKSLQRRAGLGAAVKKGKKGRTHEAGLH